MVAYEKELIRICKGKGLPDTPRFAMNMISSLLSDSLDLLCGKYPTVESCEQQHPLLMKGIDMAMLDHRRFNFTAVIPLLDIIQKLDGKINV